MTFEAKFSDKLRSLSSFRSLLVEKCSLLLPSGRFINIIDYDRSPVMLHIVVLVVMNMMAIAIFFETKSFTASSLHPIFMTLGLMLYCESIVVYRNRFLLDALSPIMQHSRSTKVRVLHQSLNILASSFIFLGLMCIFTAKVRQNNLIIPSSVHSIFGTVAIILIILQVISGSQKLSNYAVSNVTIRRWHSDLGLLVLDVLVLTTTLGLAQYLSFSVYSFYVWISVIVLWVCVNIQTKGKLIDDTFVEYVEDLPECEDDFEFVE